MPIIDGIVIKFKMTPLRNFLRLLESLEWLRSLTGSGGSKHVNASMLKLFLSEPGDPSN